MYSVMLSLHYMAMQKACQYYSPCTLGISPHMEGALRVKNCTGRHSTLAKCPEWPPLQNDDIMLDNGRIQRNCEKYKCFLLRTKISGQNRETCSICNRINPSLAISFDFLLKLNWIESNRVGNWVPYPAHGGWVLVFVHLSGRLSHEVRVWISRPSRRWVMGQLSLLSTAGCAICNSFFFMISRNLPKVTTTLTAISIIVEAPSCVQLAPMLSIY